MNGMIRQTASTAVRTPSSIKQFERTCPRPRHQFKNAASTQAAQAGHAHRSVGREFARNFPAINAQRPGVLLRNIRRGKAAKPERTHGACCGAAAATYAILVEMDCSLANTNRLDWTYALTGMAGRIARCAQGQAGVLQQTKRVILAQRPVFEFYGSIAQARHRLFPFSGYFWQTLLNAPIRYCSGCCLPECPALLPGAPKNGPPQPQTAGGGLAFSS